MIMVEINQKTFNMRSPWNYPHANGFTLVSFPFFLPVSHSNTVSVWFCVRCRLHASLAFIDVLLALECVLYLIKFKTKERTTTCTGAAIHYQVKEYLYIWRLHSTQKRTHKKALSRTTATTTIILWSPLCLCVSMSMSLCRDIAINVLTQFAPLILTTWFCISLCRIRCVYIRLLLLFTFPDLNLFSI